MVVFIYLLLITSTKFSDATNMCDEYALSELQLELSDLRQEISDLRQNYSLIQGELKQTEELNNVEEKTKRQEGDVDVEEKLRRLRHAVRLLNEAINSYDDFVKNLEVPVEEALRYASGHDGYTCEMDFPAEERVEIQMGEFRQSTMTNATKIQEQIHHMFSAINRGLKEELVQE